MGFDWKEIFTVSMVLFAVIDIVGSIPIIVDLRNKLGHIQSEKASIVAMIIMIVFLFVGEEILKLIGIDASSFAVAGSFVLFFLALETGSLSAVQWFLNQGASPTAPDRAGRLPLETVIQRAAIADEFDDHLDACPAMLTALMAAGADAKARNLQGAPLADLARAAGLSLPQ